MKYELAHTTRRGARSSNQDRIGVAERSQSLLMALADGLGGHAGGALAAEVAVKSALGAFRSSRRSRIANPPAFLALCLMEAHNQMKRMGASQDPPIEPRTTCVLCLVQDGYAYWAHVGDSRLYHLRNGEIRARTLDDTRVERLRLAGVLTEEEMPAHPDKSRLLKCLGGRDAPSISLGQETLLEKDDVLLLCSDGLWEALDPAEIAAQLRGDKLEEAVEDMLLLAEDRMRTHCDNLSAVCLRWGERFVLAPPLRPRSGATTTEPRLKAEARRKLPPRPRPLPEQGIDETLTELEEFMRRHDPKKPV